CLDGFGTDRRGEDRPVAQRAAQAGTQAVVRRHQKYGFHAVCGRPAIALSGNSTVKTAPGAPDLFAARMVAPCAFAMLAQMARPSPEPCTFVVTNGSKIVVSRSSGTPEPVSST